MVNQPYHLTPLLQLPSRDGVASGGGRRHGLQVSRGIGLGKGRMAMRGYRFCAEKAAGGDERSRKVIDGLRDRKMSSGAALRRHAWRCSGVTLDGR
jgi:hypothetical protein